MISQKRVITNQKKGVETMYKLNYKEHMILKQAAYLIMQNHNNKEYNSDKKQKQFIKYQQTLTILYRKPQSELLDIIDRYQTYIEKQTNIKLIDTNQRNIIIPKLKNITEQQLEHIIQQLQKLETLYYIDIDIDYNNKQLILEAYQQLMYYKKYNIKLQLKDSTILVGNIELLDKVVIQC